MSQAELIGEQCDLLAARIQGNSDWGSLRAVYLDLVPVVGEIQGAVRTYTRDHVGSAEARRLDHAFEQLQNTIRQVGHDIRLSSPAALRIGLESCLEQVREILQELSSAPR
ncbi:MAG TPA: hypothetical protein VF898_05885 [Chloroflexota bacterium]